MFYLRLDDDEVNTIISTLCAQIDSKESLLEMYRRQAAKPAESTATPPQGTSEVTEDD